MSIANMTDERINDLQWYWDNETNVPDTQDWRETLSLEEHALVDTWDEGYTLGIYTICQEILALERKATNLQGES